MISSDGKRHDAGFGDPLVECPNFFIQQFEIESVADRNVTKIRHAHIVIGYHLGGGVDVTNQAGLRPGQPADRTALLVDG